MITDCKITYNEQLHHVHFCNKQAVQQTQEQRLMVGDLRKVVQSQTQEIQRRDAVCDDLKVQMNKLQKKRDEFQSRNREQQILIEREQRKRACDRSDEKTAQDSLRQQVAAIKEKRDHAARELAELRKQNKDDARVSKQHLGKVRNLTHY